MQRARKGHGLTDGAEQVNHQAVQDQQAHGPEQGQENQPLTTAEGLLRKGKSPAPHGHEDKLLNCSQGAYPLSSSGSSSIDYQGSTRNERSLHRPAIGDIPAIYCGKGGYFALTPVGDVGGNWQLM